MTGIIYNTPSLKYTSPSFNVNKKYATTKPTVNTIKPYRSILKPRFLQYTENSILLWTSTPSTNRYIMPQGSVNNGPRSNNIKLCCWCSQLNIPSSEHQGVQGWHLRSHSFSSPLIYKAQFPQSLPSVRTTFTSLRVSASSTSCQEWVFVGQYSGRSLSVSLYILQLTSAWSCLMAVLCAIFAIEYVSDRFRSSNDLCCVGWDSSTGSPCKQCTWSLNIIIIIFNTLNCKTCPQ